MHLTLLALALATLLVAPSDYVQPAGRPNPQPYYLHFREKRPSLSKVLFRIFTKNSEVALAMFCLHLLKVRILITKRVRKCSPTF